MDEVGLAKQLKDLSDEFESVNDRDKLRYFIKEIILDKIIEPKWLIGGNLR